MGLITDSLQFSGNTYTSVVITKISTGSTTLDSDPNSLATNQVIKTYIDYGGGETGGTASISTALSSEISTRAGADASLSAAIGSSSPTGVTSLSTAVSTEISNRTSADTSLTTQVSSEISRSTSLSTVVSSEISRSTSLSTAVSSEISTRSATDSSLSTSVVQPWIDINRNGFVDNSQTSISFNDTTYVFTLSAITSTWSYYRAGIKYSINGNKTVTLPGSPPTAGTYFISINSTDGTLQSGTTVWTLEDATLPVALIKFDSTKTPKYFIAEERHTIAIDRKIHKYLHQTRGTQFISGGALDGPTLTTATDSGVCFGVADTVIADEDLYQTLTGLTRPNGTVNTYNIFYRTNSTTWSWQPSEVPFKYTSTGYIEYDNGGSMTSGITSKYYNTYLLFADFNLTGRFSIIPGRGQFSSLVDAQAENVLYFDFTGFPVAESVIAYQFTWGTSVSYTNKGKCRLEANPVRINVSTVTTSTTGAGISHNSLAGVQGGTTNEMYHLTNTDYIVATGISTTVSTEISNRVSGDASLSSSVSNEVSTRTGADTSLTTAVSGEVSTRTGADTSLTTAISNEVSTRAGADASLSAAIGSSSPTGITSLSTAVSTEISNRTSADTSLTTAVSSEISTRTGADTSLTTAISNEVSTRTGADTSLTTALSNEISTRTSVDSSLSTAVAGATGNVTKVGTPADNQVGVWTGNGTIEGPSNFTFDGTTLSVTTGRIIASYSDYGMYTSKLNNHLTQNAYYDGSWKSYGSDSTYGGAVVFQTSGGQAGAGSALKIMVDTAISGANEALTLTTLFNVLMNGNVGIGGTPGTDLQVGGTVAGTRTIRLHDSVHYWDVQHYASNNGYYLKYDGNEKLYLSSSGDMTIASTATCRDYVQVLDTGGSEGFKIQWNDTDKSIDYIIN